MDKFLDKYGIPEIDCCVIRAELKGKDDFGKIERLSDVFKTTKNAVDWKREFMIKNSKLKDKKHDVTISWNNEHIKLPLSDLIQYSNCLQCNGVGMIIEETITCPACEGTGVKKLRQHSSQLVDKKIK